MNDEPTRRIRGCLTKSGTSVFVKRVLDRHNLGPGDRERVAPSKHTGDHPGITASTAADSVAFEIDTRQMKAVAAAATNC